MKHPFRIDLIVAMLCVVSFAGIAGCSGGEFRAEDVPAKADVQKDIDRVKASTTIPDQAKIGIIKGLQKKMEHAK